MKITIPFFLCLFLFAESYSQRIISQECLQLRANDYILMIHDNKDLTTSILLENLTVYDSSQFKYSFIRLDKDKKVIQSRSLPVYSAPGYNATDRIACFDEAGAFLFVFQNRKYHAYKFDADGNFLWEADSIGEFFDSTGIEVTARQDGGFIINSKLFNDRSKDFVAISNRGQVLWKKHYNTDGLIQYNETYALNYSLPNGNTFLSMNPIRAILGLDSGIILNFIVDSLGNTIAADTIRNAYINNSYNPSQPVSHTLKSTNIPFFYYTPVSGIQHLILLDGNNLNTLKSITDSSLSLLSFDPINYSLITDTTHLFSVTYDGLDGLYLKDVTCMDMNFDTIWKYTFPVDSSYYVYNYSDPVRIADNNSIFVAGRLIRNGTLAWVSHTPTVDSISYNGIEYFAGSYVPYNYNFTDNTHIFMLRQYSTNSSAYPQTIHRFQVFDFDSGTSLTDFILDPYHVNPVYMIPFGNMKSFVIYNRADCLVADAIYSDSVNTVRAMAFIDENTNGIKDSAEHNYLNGFVNMINGNIRQQKLLNGHSFTTLYADTGTIITQLQLYSGYYTVVPPQYSRSHTTYRNRDTLLFALVPIPGKNDVSLHLLNNFMTRMGRFNDYTLVLENKGTTVSAGKIKLVPDKRIDLVNITPGFSYNKGDTLVWDIQALLPTEKLTISLHIQGNEPPLLNEGDTIISEAWYEAGSEDLSPGDNYSQVKEIIITSRDPNDKAVLSGNILTPTQISNGDYLSYIIHFQNTGNDTAFRVIVIDTLADKVNVNTLQVIGASAPYTLEILQNKILKFTFEDIRLSYDTLSASSKGYIAYRVKANMNLPLGSAIENTADIFFDYNPPIRTNTVQTQVLLLSSAAPKHQAYGQLYIYPNPNAGNFIIHYVNKGEGPLQLQLIDIYGNVEYEARNHYNNIADFPVNASTLAKGMYWIRIFDGDQFYSQPIIIQ